MTKYLSVALLAALLAVGGAWMLTRGNDDGADLGLTPLAGAAQAQAAATETTPETTPDTPTAELDLASVIEMAEGAADAPVTIIEYASYTCPHCAVFHADQYQQLKPYIADGRVRFVVREIYQHRFGLWASMVTRCSGDTMRFFGLTDVLFDTQSDWIGEGDPATIAANLRTIGLTAGLDPAALDACMQDEVKARTLIAWSEQNATADEVEATPTLIINGELYANMSFAELAAIIDPIIADSGWTAP